MLVVDDACVTLVLFDTVLRPGATRGVFWGVFKEKMIMHMVVVTLALGVFQKNVFFFTFHLKVFHKLLLTQNYLFFYF
ncbi:hypothetical protein Hanom_Chr08g00690441 [Helianthus anomalus]